MKLLVITQKVDINDDNLGFFHGWLEEFAERVDKLFVVGLEMGQHNLPKNVEVYSMGKERGLSRIGRFFRLQKYLLKNLKEIDGIFVHMCPIYAIAAFPLSALFRKKIFLWFAHKSYTPTLWLSEKLVNGIVTSSQEGFRMQSGKVDIIGQGIDVKKFVPQNTKKERKNASFHIITAGRINPSKDIEILIEAIAHLINLRGFKNLNFSIIGSNFTEEFEPHLRQLKELCKERAIDRYIDFTGGVPHGSMPDIFHGADLFIHASKTGSMDKVVLEAMASGMPVISSSEAYRDILGSIDKGLCFREGDAASLAEKIDRFTKISGEDRSRLTSYLRNFVVENHNLDNLVGKIINKYA